MSREPRTDDLRPMTSVQIQQTRDFVESLQEKCETYWDMVEIGDQLSRELEITPELVILYADAVEDYNSWYEGWRMNTWRIEGESPFGPAIVPPLLVSHFVLSVQFDHTKPFAIGSIHTFHDSEILEPIPVGAKVRITAKAIDKFVKRERRYVRHEVTVEDAADGAIVFPRGSRHPFPLTRSADWKRKLGAMLDAPERQIGAANGEAIGGDSEDPRRGRGAEARAHPRRGCRSVLREGLRQHDARRGRRAPRDDQAFHLRQFRLQDQLCSRRSARAACSAAADALDAVLARRLSPRETPGNVRARLRDRGPWNARSTSPSTCGKKRTSNPADARRIGEMRREFFGRMTKLLEKGAAAGEFDVDDAQMAALGIGGAVTWSTFWYRPDGRLSLAEIAESDDEAHSRPRRGVSPTEAPARRAAGRGRGSWARLRASIRFAAQTKIRCKLLVSRLLFPLE